LIRVDGGGFLTNGHWIAPRSSLREGDARRLEEWSGGRLSATAAERVWRKATRGARTAAIVEAYLYEGPLCPLARAGSVYLGAPYLLALRRITGADRMLVGGATNAAMITRKGEPVAAVMPVRAGEDKFPVALRAPREVSE
jgi:hypothetical protein